MDAQFADKKIVGWYHSHPGFGIFLSEYDLFIHRNFFTAPGRWPSSRTPRPASVASSPGNLVS